MTAYYSLNDSPIPQSQKTAVALGYFDGVHLGHRAVINQVVEFANKNNLQASVFTFTFNVKNTKGSMLLSPQMREDRVRRLLVQNYICPVFDEFCSFSCDEFVKTILVDFLHAKAVFCGSDYKFGKNAAGDILQLKQLCAKYDIQVFTVDTALWQGKAVSSTRIKKELQNGNMAAVNAMLTLPYTISLPVKHGKGLGHALGFPTINQIFSADMVTPKQGVYITRTLINDVYYPSATGIGTRPTVNTGNDITCETFITGFKGDLYNKQPEVQFFDFLAPTQKFNNTDQLKAAIKIYADKAVKFFNKE